MWYSQNCGSHSTFFVIPADAGAVVFGGAVLRRGAVVGAVSGAAITNAILICRAWCTCREHSSPPCIASACDAAAGGERVGWTWSAALVTCVGFVSVLCTGFRCRFSDGVANQGAVTAGVGIGGDSDGDTVCFLWVCQNFSLHI